jgi:hypothetical protein
VKQKPERLIEQEILIWLRSLGIFCFKNITGGFFDARIGRFRKQTSPFAINGTSDILGLMRDGKFLAIECKAKYGKPTPEQIKFLMMVNASGGIGFIARSLEDVKENLKKYGY